MIKFNNAIKGFDLIALLIVIFSSCQTAKENKNLVLEFEGRDIDISPYFKDVPFSQFSLSRDGSKMIFFKTGDSSTRLQWLDVNTNTDIRKGEDITNVDFSKRNCWSPKYNAADGFVYWIGDEKNDEIINVYRTKPGSNEVAKLTNVPYIYAWNFNDAGTKIAYVARMGQNEDRLDELRIFDLKTLKDSLVYTDKSDFRFTWGDISWQPEEKGLALLALKNADRTHTNVVYIDLETRKMSVLTDASRAASVSGCQIIEDWYDKDIYYFLSDQDGYSNLYKYDLNDKSVKQITFGKLNIDDVGMVIIDGKKYLLTYQKNPIKTIICLLDPSGDKPVWVEDSPLNLELGAAVNDHVRNIVTSTSEIFQLLDVSVSKTGTTSKVLLDVPADIKKKLVNSTVERLDIETFDTDSVTGKPRMLHAYLYKPLKPLPKKKQIVMIESFYGGENRYDKDYQIFAQAGIYVLSPSPRGSSGFGRDFAALNDRDLGGNEILDIIYAAKFISNKLEIPPARVGVFGMSHGGYATMRLMTFPGEVNNHKAAFPFGFGIETAGFSDIIYQHNTSNIPDWTYLEAGDPKKDSLKLADRSPINHADIISGPLLLIHGSNDNRVAVEGSRRMAEKLKELNKPYTYIEFPGLGHGIKGIENSKKYFSECFKFLEKKVLN